MAKIEKWYRRICPLLSIVGTDSNGAPCAEEDCAWWDGGQCVLCSMADNLEEIAANSNHQQGGRT